jgi:hypothetical protein
MSDNSFAGAGFPLEKDGGRTAIRGNPAQQPIDRGPNRLDSHAFSNQLKHSIKLLWQ